MSKDRALYDAILNAVDGYTGIGRWADRMAEEVCRAVCDELGVSEAVITAAESEFSLAYTHEMTPSGAHTILERLREAGGLK